VVAWGGYLLLVECKFVRGVHGPAEAWRAAGEIQHAIEQLTRQKEIALREWDVLRAAAPDLGLPASAYAADRIIRLVVASVPHFTGRRESDLFVIDERCLARFFGSPNIAAMAMDPAGADREVGILDTVRTSIEFVVEEFIRHLESPAPVNTFLKGLTVTQRRVRIVEPQDPRILVSHAEFAAPDYSDKIEMMPKRDRNRKKRERRRRARSG
jgi:hypothetical protein